MSDRFEFGQNWSNFIKKHFSEEKLEESRAHLLDVLQCQTLEGKTFLDIGCGSGLHSLAALRSGAKSVRGFDYDANSVAASKYLHQYEGSPSNWVISRGDALDADFISSVEPADIVYSWGVLHHTGDMWTAIRNAATRVTPGGTFYIALYSSDVQIDPTPEEWLEIKQDYVNSGKLKRICYVLWYIWRFEMQKRPWNIVNLFRQLFGARGRGMTYLTDVRDWVGGWPMEFAADQDVIDFADKELGMQLKNIRTGQANTEFVFVKND